MLVGQGEAEVVLADVLEQGSDHTVGHPTGVALLCSMATPAAASSLATETASSSGETTAFATPSTAATNAASSCWNDSSYSRNLRPPDPSNSAATSHVAAM